MYNFVVDVYNIASKRIIQWSMFIYVLQARYQTKCFLSNLPAIHFWNQWIWCYVNKTEANLASTNVLAARCVRVIHAQCVLQFALLSRTLLRSSSNNEPSDPPYRIIFLFLFLYIYNIYRYSIHSQWQTTMILLNGKVFWTIVISFWYI